MGVRGLQTFMEKYCPEACYTVKIAEYAQKYRLETNIDPVILVDAQSCYNYWYNELNWIIGFEIQELVYRLKMFIEAFLNIGIKLIFFFGGLTPDKKREVWIKRRKKNLHDLFRVFDFIDAGTSFKNIPPQYKSIPPNMGFTISLILKYILNSEVYFTIDECDEEIIKFAHEHKSFAIFGQDTDFVISDTDSIILSSRSFNITDMTTLLYDRVKLAEILNINVKELPLYAIVAGNEYITSEALRPLHNSLCKEVFYKEVPFHILMPAIGKYINSMSKLSIDEMLNRISYDIFNDVSKKEFLVRLYDSYLPTSSPEISSVPMTKWDKIIKIARYRHKNIIFPVWIYAIISEQIFEISTAFEDLRRICNTNVNRNYVPSSTILRPLRQRLYGILLFEHDKFPISVKEYCGDNINSYSEPVLVEPVVPIVHHPGLLILWSDDNSSRIKEIKWKLFASSISPSITNYKLWSTLQAEVLIPAAVLYYLKEENYMAPWEVNAVIATIVTLPSYPRKKINDISFEIVDKRAIHISVTFIRAYSYIVTLLAVCGYPVPMCANIAFIKFEGKLFQIKYKSAKNKDNYEKLCDNNKEYMKHFFEIKNLIYGTTKNNIPRKLRSDFNEHKEIQNDNQVVLKQ